MSDKKKLNARQESFCRKKAIGLKDGQAAVEAGYSEKTSYAIACNLLKKTEIKNRIAELSQPEIDKDIATKEDVERFLTSMMRGEQIEECVVIEGTGDGCSEARIIKKKVTPKDRLKAGEMLAKRYNLIDANKKEEFGDNKETTQDAYLKHLEAL